MDWSGYANTLGMWSKPVVLEVIWTFRPCIATRVIWGVYHSRWNPFTRKVFQNFLSGLCITEENHMTYLSYSICCCGVGDQDTWAWFLVQLLDEIATWNITPLLYFIDKKNWWTLYPLYFQIFIIAITSIMWHRIFTVRHEITWPK